MKHQTNSKCSAAFFSGALNFKSFAGYSNLANLSAPRADEIEDTTESGAELEWSVKYSHINDFVS
jgi:hypothetical protein